MRDKICSTLIFEEEFEKSNFLCVNLPKQGLNIVGVYRSHDTNVNEFLSRIDTITSKFVNSIMLGDFNLDLLNLNSRDIVNYNNTLLNNGFIPLNKISETYATRIGRTSKTVIDHFITDLVKFTYFFLYNRDITLRS